MHHYNNNKKKNKQSADLLKKRFQHKCFFFSLTNFFRTPFLTELDFFLQNSDLNSQLSQKSLNKLMQNYQISVIVSCKECN